MALKCSDRNNKMIGSSDLNTDDMLCKKKYTVLEKEAIPMTGESPTLPTILFLIPPVDVAQATLPVRSTATAPTVSWALGSQKEILNYHHQYKKGHDGCGCGTAYASCTTERKFQDKP